MSNKRTILLFVVLAYALAWIIWLALWLSGVGLNSPWSQLASIVAMWMPALAVFLLGKITNQPGGIKSKLVVNLKSNWRFYLLAIWLPAVISFLGAGLYFLVFPISALVLNLFKPSYKKKVSLNQPFPYLSWP